MASAPACRDRSQSARGATRQGLGGPDAGRGSGDLGVPAVCTATCIAKARFLCGFDTGQNMCVECLSDAQCTGNPSSFGAVCHGTRRTCSCRNAADCSGKVNGRACIATPFLPICGCRTDGDCAAPLRCVGDQFAVRVCARPCAANTDCTDPHRPNCDTTSGRCVACRSSGDCHSKPAPRCSPTLGECVACLTDAHCTNGLRPRCDPGTGACVGCTSDSHCAGSAANGGRCLRSTLGTRACGCTSDADCGKSALGPTCDPLSRRCTCAVDKDCAAPRSTCAPAYLGAGFSQCQRPCTTSSDCGIGLRCIVASGRCAECGQDAHCSEPGFPFCDGSRNSCAQCQKDAHCSGETPLCNRKTGRCVACKTSADCAAHPSGAVCSAGVCSCAKDTDCAAAHAYGGTCVVFGGLRRCGCEANSGCPGKTRGPACALDVAQCSCTVGKDCTSTAAPNCVSPFVGANHKICQRMCTVDADCTTSDAPYCRPSLGQCLACHKDAHCAGNQWAKICRGTSGCRECRTNTDCTNATLGSWCSAGVCLCKTNGDCSANAHGKVCDTTTRVCSCTTDTDCPTGKKCAASTLGKKVRLCK